MDHQAPRETPTPAESTPPTDGTQVAAPQKAKRHRLRRACVHCRRTHVACNDFRPCLECALRNIPCVDASDTNAAARAPKAAAVKPSELQSGSGGGAQTDHYQPRGRDSQSRFVIHDVKFSPQTTSGRQKTHSSVSAPTVPTDWQGAVDSANASVAPPGSSIGPVRSLSYPYMAPPPSLHPYFASDYSNGMYGTNASFQPSVDASNGNRRAAASSNGVPLIPPPGAFYTSLPRPQYPLLHHYMLQYPHYGYYPPVAKPPPMWDGYFPYDGATSEQFEGAMAAAAAAAADAASEEQRHASLLAQYGNRIAAASPMTPSGPELAKASPVITATRMHSPDQPMLSDAQQFRDGLSSAAPLMDGMGPPPGGESSALRIALDGVDGNRKRKGD